MNLAAQNVQSTLASGCKPLTNTLAGCPESWNHINPLRSECATTARERVDTDISG
jgi:hypothetical protein